MTTQPEALRLAERLDDFALALPAYGHDLDAAIDAALSATAQKEKSL